MKSQKRSVSRLAAATAFLAALGGGAATFYSLTVGPDHAVTRAASILAVAVAAALLVRLTFRITHERRLEQLTRFLEEQSVAQDGLRRLPHLGDDEIGRSARALNRVLAAGTHVRVSMIDQSFELEQKARELELSQALADKSGELEQRLAERALLFELLRSSTESAGLTAVLESLAARLGPALRMRELGILVREGDRFVLRAAYGFEDPTTVIGRSIGAGEGISGEVIDAREPIIVRDVSVDPEYLAFWGLAPREGCFAAVPIRDAGASLGILALARPSSDPLADLEVRFLSAVADTISLAIRHAQLVDDLEELSTHDALTGLANRRLFESRLSMEVERARRYQTALSVVTVDVDHFKELNDTFGHPVGDVVLVALAEALERNVRRVDTVARVGGEEFVVVLPRTDLAAAERVAEKIRACVAALHIEELGDRNVTLSLGVARLRPGEPPEDLLSRADRALYDAKRGGRDRVALAERARQPAA